MFNKLKQIKDLRDQAKIIQTALAEESITCTAAWGKISVQMNGNLQVTAVTVDPELLATDKKSALEDGMKEVMNDAIKKIQKVMAEKVQKMGGLNLPGMS